MHELSVAEAIVDAVREEIAQRPGARATKVGVKIGALSCVDPDALTFAFDVMAQGSDLEPIILDIEYVERRHRCPACGTEFAVHDYLVTCPACGEFRTQCAQGHELEFSYLELEEPCLAST